MADTIWVYAEISDDKITTTSLEMLAKAAEVGKAEAVLLGPAPDDAVQTLANHGASKIYRSADAVYKDYLILPAAETVAETVAAGVTWNLRMSVHCPPMARTHLEAD